MKNVIKTIVLLLALGLTLTSNAQCISGKGDQALIKKAICAAREAGCLGDHPDNMVIYGFVETVSICFFTGAVRKVSLYAYHLCPPGYFCAQYIRLVATVEFDCDETADMVTCEP